MVVMKSMPVTLDDLDPPRWPDPPSDATRLVRRVHAARRQPLADLTPEDLRLLVSQRVALAHVLPIAVRVLTENPLISGDYYDGDLLLAVVGVPDNGWNGLSVTVHWFAVAIAGLPDAANADLPKGSTEVLARFVATYR